MPTTCIFAYFVLKYINIFNESLKELNFEKRKKGK